MNRQAVEIALRAAWVLALLVVGYGLFSFLIPFLYPFLIGWLIAMSAEPLVRWLERRARLPRWAGVTLTLVLIVSAIVTGLIFLISQIVIELTHLAELLPAYLDQFNQYILHTFVYEENALTRTIQNIQDYLEKNPEQRTEILNSIRDNLGLVATKGTELITSIIAGIGTFLGNLPYYATVLVFCILAAFFIGLDWPRLHELLLRFIPDRIRSTGGLVIRDLKKALFGFVRAQLTLITITGVIVWIGFTIIGLNYALTIALVTAVVDLLPYFGVGAVLVPWAIYLLLTGNFSMGAGIAILYVIILIVRQMLEPKLVATNIGLNPLLTLVALFVGLKAIGILGLLVGPVVAVILVALYRARVFQDLYRFIRNGSDTVADK
ncbi:sporulation integral membrane protein YtvI [Desmospora profundinema]|uniref:Sporulation integral membrane protein YtvI n=1 Tax=Desmospora profundinema TaxID=1571184 RepID=A0ABU1IRR7_9BACL|nr:sporulation integral membrane protein YtvI [Desmospora profundinema]MDR6226619.1 sporulation integral membrane protein YtvI [Desmospora profundinema]